MKKWIVITGFILTIGAFDYCLYKVYMNSYVKYIPVMDTGEGYVEAPQINTVEHKKNLQALLKANGVRWKLRNGGIYIQRKWIRDKEMVLNYTNKANEAEYVKYVPVVLKDNIGCVEVPELKVNKENLRLVLNYHHEKWQIRDGQFFITKKLAVDKVLVHNYTKKANDDKFIQQIKESN